MGLRPLSSRHHIGTSQRVFCPCIFACRRICIGAHECVRQVYKQNGDAQTLEATAISYGVLVIPLYTASAPGHNWPKACIEVITNLQARCDTYIVHTYRSTKRGSVAMLSLGTLRQEIVH